MRPFMIYAMSVLSIGYCSGCRPASSVSDQRSLAAAVLAVEEVAQASTVPDSEPAPAVGERCDNCSGTGKLGDGRVTLVCPVCQGTGKVPVKPSGNRPPSSVSVSETSKTFASIPRVQCLMFSCESCAPCQAMWHEIATQLPPVGWKVGEAPTSMIRLVRKESDPDRLVARYSIRQWPTLVLLVDGRETTRIVGRMSAASVAQRIVLLRKQTFQPNPRPSDGS